MAEEIHEDERDRLISGGLWPISDGDVLRDCCFTLSAPQRVAIGRPQGKHAAFAGCLYWILFFMLFIMYLGFYSVVMKNQHLKYEAPMGSARVTLRRPTAFNESSGHHCSPQNSDCVNAFPNVTQKPYCLRSDLKSETAKLDCRIWDEDSVVARNLGNDLVFATHVKTWTQRRTCDGLMSENTRCKELFKTQKRDEYYLAAVEDFTISIAHSIRTPSIISEIDMETRGQGLRVCSEDQGFHGHEDAHAKDASAERMLGEHSHDDDASQTVEKAGCHFTLPVSDLQTTEDPHLDTFKLSSFLDAAGACLDEPARPGLPPRREVGTVLILTIHFQNTEPFRSWLRAFYETLPITYYYTLQEMTVSEYKLRESYFKGKWASDERLVVEFFGIHLVVRFTGLLATWSWSQVLVLLTVGMTTVFSAELIVVYYIRFVLPLFGRTSDGISPAMLAENFVEYHQKIDKDWVTILESQVAQVRSSGAYSAPSQEVLGSPRDMQQVGHPAGSSGPNH